MRARSLPLDILLVFLGCRVELFGTLIPRQSPARDAEGRLIPLVRETTFELALGIGHRQPDGMVGRGRLLMTDEIAAIRLEGDAQVNAEGSPRRVAPHRQRRGWFREMNQASSKLIHLVFDAARLQTPNPLIAKVILNIHGSLPPFRR